MNTLQGSPAGIFEEQIHIREKCFHASGTFKEFEKQDIEQSIIERFEQQANKYPNRVAVRTENYKLTYCMLNNLANRIAYTILEQCGEGLEPIALLFELDAPLIAAILGVMKAGKYYVPLDQTYPNERLRYMLEDSKASLLVTNTKNLSVARPLTKHVCQLLEMNFLDDNISQENPCIPLSPETICYIVYTSGSTGKPKGVMQNHRNVLHKIMTYTNYIHICAEDRLTLLTPAGSSSSVWHIFGAICNGSSLYPFNLNSENISSLRSWLKNEAITIYNSVPALFRCVFSSLSTEERFNSLRVIFLGGDAALKKDADLYKAYCSEDCFLVNSYGTTETGSICYYIIEKKTNVTDAILPVGYPLQDKDILILDEKGNRIDFNEVGEIAIKSQFLSPGYWRKPSLTISKFSNDPDCINASIYRTGDVGRIQSDRCLTHLGRKDFQVNIRGNMVEIAEVEATLLSNDTIKEAIVVAWENGKSRHELIAYLVPTTKITPSVSHIRRFLSNNLPDFMIPSRFIMMESLPLNPNGKVDRKLLPKPDHLRPNLESPFVPPRTPVEKTLAEIWSNVLKIEVIGIHDKFLELGGDSLQAIRIVSKVLNKYKVKLSLQSLFSAPTISNMAGLIIQNQAKMLDQNEFDRILDDLEKLSDKEANDLIKLL
jgi:amino acid adenylation domain-containing protein